MSERRSRLEMMLADSKKWRSMHADVDAWLQAMEAQFRAMGPVAHNVDVLETQLKEQKV